MSPEDKVQHLEQKVKRLEKSSSDSDFERTKTELLQELRSDLYNSDTVCGDEIDLRELWKVIWSGRLKIIAITGLFAILSVIYATSLPNIYKSESLLVSNSKESGGSGLSALAGQFGGLASLAGVNLRGGGTDKTSFALEVLKSREFLYKFIEDNNIKALIMATEGWDSSSNSFIYDKDIYDIDKEVWIRKVAKPFKPEPSINETYQKFLEDNLSVSRDDDTGLVKIAVEHYSPYLAKRLVELLIQAINQTIKNQDMEEAIKSISYLQQELENTKLSGAQTMFYQLIEQQQQTLMLTKVRDDYVLKVVDRAVVAEEKIKPQRALICVLGTMLGGLLSIIIVFIGHIVKDKE